MPASASIPFSNSKESSPSNRRLLRSSHHPLLTSPVRCSENKNWPIFFPFVDLFSPPPNLPDCAPSKHLRSLPIVPEVSCFIFSFLGSSLCVPFVDGFDLFLSLSRRNPPFLPWVFTALELSANLDQGTLVGKLFLFLPPFHGHGLSGSSRPPQKWLGTQRPRHDVITFIKLTCAPMAIFFKGFIVSPIPGFFSLLSTNFRWDLRIVHK